MRLLKLNRLHLLSYGLPLLVILCSTSLSLSPILKQYPQIAIGITLDLTVLSPLLFLLFSRKTDIPKFLAVPIFVIGVLVAFYILPQNDRYLLNLITIYIVPLVEAGVLILVGFKVFRAIKGFRLEKNHSDDLFLIIKKNTLSLLGKNRFTQFLASEIAIFYYALFVWKRKENRWPTFTHYKDNGGLTLIAAFLAIILIETIALHLFLMQWSGLAAWILTILSSYTAIVIFGHLKALVLRPSQLTDQELILKNGIIADIKIDLSAIENVEFCSTDLVYKDGIVAHLGLSKESQNHNIALYFNKPQIIEKVYGFTSDCDILLLEIDDKNRFLNTINAKILELDP